jgi:hypothetical protein
MSKSYKGEARAQARADQQRRAARAAKHADNFLESHDSIRESSTKRDRTPQSETMDANPKPSPRVPA